jgi:hypothetical protein
MDPSNNRYVIISGKRYDDLLKTLNREILTAQSILIVEDDVRDTEVILNLFRDLEFRSVCYITLNKTYFFMLQSLKVKRIENSKFFFIDGISRLITESLSKEENCIFLESRSLDEFNHAIVEALKKKPDFLIFDSISSLLISCEESEVSVFFEKILNSTKSNKVKTISIVLADDWDKKTLQCIVKLFDKIIIVFGNMVDRWKQM